MKAWIVVFAMLGFAGVAAGQDEKGVKDVFRDALFAEEGERDLEKAVAGYEAVVEAVDAQRGFGASALFRLGECYRKLGKHDDAAAAYLRVVREFPGEATLVEEATARLEGMGRGSGSAPAVPAPSVTTAPISDEEAKALLEARRVAENSPDLLTGGAPGPALSRLHQAAQNSHLELAKFLLANGADVNSTHGGGWTPLHVAVNRQHKRMAELLIENGADVNAIDHNGSTVLASAVQTGGAAVLNVLLDAGATTPKPGEPGRAEVKTSPIGVAASQGKVALVEQLAKLGVDDVATAVASGRSALGAVVGQGDVATARKLIALGAQPNATYVDGEEPALFAAVDSLNVEMVELLLASGADVSMVGGAWGGAANPTPRPAVPTPSKPRSTGGAPNPAILKALQDAQRAQQQKSSSGRTGGTRRRTVVLPPSRGSRGDEGSGGPAGTPGVPKGETALLRVVKVMGRVKSPGEFENGVKIFNTLVGAGANVNAVDPSFNVSVLHYVASLSRYAPDGEPVAMIRTLLKKGANPHAVSLNGEQPIASAATDGARDALWDATYYGNFAGRGDAVWMGKRQSGQVERFDPAHVDTMARLVEAMIERGDSRSSAGVFLPDVKNVRVLRAETRTVDAFDYLALCADGAAEDDIKLKPGDFVEFNGVLKNYENARYRRMSDLPQPLQSFVVVASRPEVVVKVGDEPERSYRVSREYRNHQAFTPGSEVPRSSTAYDLLRNIGVMSRADIDNKSMRVVRSDGSAPNEREGLEHGDRIEIGVLPADSEDVIEKRGRSLYIAREADGFVGRVASGREGVLGLVEEGVTWGIFLTLAFPREADYLLMWPDLKRARIDLIGGGSLAAKEGEPWGFALDAIVPWGSIVELPALPEGERVEGRYALDEALMLEIANKWARTVKVRVDGGEVWPYEVTEADFGGFWPTELGNGERYWTSGRWPSGEMRRFDSRSIELRRFLEDTGYGDRKKFDTGKVMVSVPALRRVSDTVVVEEAETSYVSGYSSQVLLEGTTITLRAVSGSD